MYECDGMITGCAPAYDGDALQHFDAWAAFRGISIYHMGPMRPFEPGTTTFDYVSKSTELAASGPGVGDHVTTFLDNALNAHGERSVFYISFGSQFWYETRSQDKNFHLTDLTKRPVGNPEHLWAVLAALEERNIPFVNILFSRVSVFLKKRVDSCASCTDGSDTRDHRGPLWAGRV